MQFPWQRCEINGAFCHISIKQQKRKKDFPSTENEVVLSPENVFPCFCEVTLFTGCNCFPDDSQVIQHIKQQLLLLLYKTNLVHIVDDGVNEVMGKWSLFIGALPSALPLEKKYILSVKVKSKRAHMNQYIFIASQPSVNDAPLIKGVLFLYRGKKGSYEILMASWFKHILMFNIVLCKVLCSARLQSGQPKNTDLILCYMNHIYALPLLHSFLS